jgi:hypothetical protein
MPGRPDLSPYVVHLTRNYPVGGPPPSFKVTPARDNLINILTTQIIEARNPYGIAVARLNKIGCWGPDFMNSQRVACFSETPLEHLDHHIQPGSWRRYQFQPYGVAFTREDLLHVGGSPVGYVNQFPGNGFKWKVHDWNALIDAAALIDGKPDPIKWQSSAVAQLTPFQESMGAWYNKYSAGQKAKDFSWEREWRFHGNFSFHLTQVEAVIVPVGQVDIFRSDLMTMLPTRAHRAAMALRYVEMVDPTLTAPLTIASTT